MKSVVYIGYTEQAQQGKIGQTTRPISRREAEIRKERKHPDYKMLHTRTLLEIEKGGTFSIAVEGHIRYRLVTAGFRQVGNDHFIVNRQLLPAFIRIAKEAADEYITWTGIAAEPWG